MNKDARVKGTRELVQDIFIEHPEWNATDVWERYKILVNDPQKAVGLSSIQKYLEDLRPTYQEIKTSGQDNPWNLGALNKPNVNIPVEALKIIVLVQKWAEKYPNPFFPKQNMANEPVTIRQAIWIGRLYKFWDVEQKNMDKKVKIVQALYLWSRAYATREMICQFKKIPFETYQLDKDLISGAVPMTVGNTILMNYSGGKFSIDTVDNELLKHLGK